MQPSQQARLVLSAEPPYGITYTNEAWTALMGHSTDQAKMFPFTLMNVRRNTRQERKRYVTAAAVVVVVAAAAAAAFLLNTCVLHEAEEQTVDRLPRNSLEASVSEERG